MGVHGHAAAVILDGEGAPGVQANLDDLGVAGDGLVHGVVEQLGEEVVQSPLVDAADIHARAFAHRLKTLEDFDVLGGIGGHGRDLGAAVGIGGVVEQGGLNGLGHGLSLAAIRRWRVNGAGDQAPRRGLGKRSARER